MQSDSLSPVFAALADPTRRAILEQLAHGPKSVGELAQPFQISLPAITKHLKVLERAGLVTTEQRAQWRVRSLKPQRLREAHAWIESYRAFWEASFDRMEALLSSLDRLQQEEHDEHGDL